MSNDDFKNVSSQIIDMLVGATLKRHKVQLDGSSLSEEEKVQLKELVEELKHNVQTLQKNAKKDEE
ncbi:MULTISPECIES: hypothetical protein [Gracilibacillus]|uniref:Uncharacterized protein n=1 Tax=Gracilibacillus dipsosauri TaxID=178340 RepID=A0A317L3A8_9BACI|nr:hypothetical protein [Gracilibacillus dipsosauri]PWU70135.1 hypothetical protein DLJ74_01325 [Gracilibacillus dipsosauri]